jgi:hypothetical protein
MYEIPPPPSTVLAGPNVQIFLAVAGKIIKNNEVVYALN